MTKPTNLTPAASKRGEETASQTIRDELYDWLQDKTNDVKSVVTKVMLPAPHKSLTGWLMTMINIKYAGDELTLYALCKLYRRHTIVYTMTRIWTTIKDGVLLSESDLEEKCDIKLLHPKYCMQIHHSNANNSLET